jgi:hypothetical protein
MIRDRSAGGKRGEGAAGTRIAQLEGNVARENPMSSTMDLGTLTRNFFLKGEEQEASGYEGVVFDDDDRASRRARFKSFDKIPRTRGPGVVVVALALVLGCGALAGTTLPGLWSGRSWVQAISWPLTRALVQGEPAPAEPVPTELIRDLPDPPLPDIH